MSEWIIVSQAAGQVGVCPRLVRKWVKAGKVPHRMIAVGNRQLIGVRVADVQDQADNASIGQRADDLYADFEFFRSFGMSRPTAIQRVARGYKIAEITAYKTIREKEHS